MVYVQGSEQGEPAITGRTAAVDVIAAGHILHNERNKNYNINGRCGNVAGSTTPTTLCSIASAIRLFSPHLFQSISNIPVFSPHDQVQDRSRVSTTVSPIIPFERPSSTHLDIVHIQ